MTSAVRAATQAQVRPAPASTRPAPVPVQVYVDNGSLVGVPVTDAARAPDLVVRTAHRNASKVSSFLAERYGRRGIDDAGSPLKVVAHYGGAGNAGAWWDTDGRQVLLGSGDGSSFGPAGNALDVVMHEATHGIVQHEVNWGSTRVQQALNESWADVLATTIDPADWKIGEDIVTPGVPGDAVRDLARPVFRHTSQLKGLPEPGEHDYSTLPSYAAYQVGSQIGKEKMGKIWYSALVDHASPRIGLPGAARATLDAAAQLYGKNSKELSAVRQAWEAIGVDHRWRASGS